MRGIIYFFVFSLLFTSANGQSQSKVLSSRATNDKEKLAAYRQIYQALQYSDIDSAVQYLKQGLNDFNARPYKPGQAALNEMLGSAYNGMGRMDEARQSNQKALALYHELNDRKGIARVNNGIGVIEGKTGNYAVAAKYFMTALKTFESLADTNGIASTYIKLGMIHDLTDNPRKSLEYYQKGLALGNGVSVENIIYLNNNVGAMYMRQDSFKKALPYFEAALALSAKPEYAQLRVLPLINIGNIKVKQGRVDEALSGYRQAEAIAIKEHMPVDQVRIAINISGIIEKSHPDSAFRMLTRALGLTRDMGNRHLEREVLEALIELNTQQQNYKAVAGLQKQLIALKDTLFTIEKEKEIASIQALHDLGKSNKEVASLKAKEKLGQSLQKTFIVIIFLFAVIAILLTAYTLRTRRLAAQIVERKMELQQANMIKDRLFSIIGHDLKGPMSNIATLANFHRDMEADPEEKLFMINSIEEVALNAVDTLDKLLNWGKSQIKGITLHQTTFSVNDVLTQKIRVLRFAAGAKNITIVNTVPDYIRVHADIEHIRFVFRNLLANAVKFTKNNGLVEISAQNDPEQNKVVFSVKDSGIGMDAQRQAQIFEPFNESHPGTANEVGTSLGLMLCKAFIEQNSGRIWVESEPGTGSVFYFTLTAAQHAS